MALIAAAIAIGEIIAEGVFTAEVGTAVAEGIAGATELGASLADPVSSAIGYAAVAVPSVGEAVVGLGETGQFVGGYAAEAAGLGDFGTAFVATGTGRVFQGAGIRASTEVAKEVFETPVKAARQVFFPKVGGEIVPKDPITILGDVIPIPENVTPHHKDLIIRHYLLFNNLSTMAPNRNFMPKSKRMTHKWCSSSGKIPATTLITGAVALPMNRLVNVGVEFGVADLHEPMGFTQMQAIYDQYTVVGARIRIDYFLNQATGGSGTMDAGVIGCCLKDDTTTLTVNGHYQELDDCQWAMVAPEGHGRLTYSVDVAKFFGIKKGLISSENTLRVSSTGTLADTTPSNALYLHIFSYNAAVGDANTIQVELVTTIEYDVLWQEPKDMAQSAYTPA